MMEKKAVRNRYAILEIHDLGEVHRIQKMSWD